MAVDGEVALMAEVQRPEGAAVDSPNNASVDAFTFKTMPGWRWYVFGRDRINGEEASLMTVRLVPPRVATPWRRRLTEVLMGSEWEWVE